LPASEVLCYSLLTMREKALTVLLVILPVCVWSCSDAESTNPPGGDDRAEDDRSDADSSASDGEPGGEDADLAADGDGEQDLDADSADSADSGGKDADGAADGEVDPDMDGDAGDGDAEDGDAGDGDAGAEPDPADAGDGPAHEELGAEDGEVVRDASDSSDAGSFNEDPIVFVHGYAMGPGEWNTMIGWFEEQGYPDEYLAAIRFSNPIQSNVINGRDELPGFVDQVITRTGCSKVDIVAHSAGGLAARLWVKLHGGHDKVRDFVTLAGVHHGNNLACLTTWLGEAAEELCPAYASQAESHNELQWILNGDPDLDDVDETPFGVEDGGGIYYHSLWTSSDLIVSPATSCCLNQRSRNDCSDPINVMFSGVGHIEMASDRPVFEAVLSKVLEHNIVNP